MTKKKFELITNIASIVMTLLTFTILAYGDIYLRKNGVKLSWMWPAVIAIVVLMFAFLFSFQKIGEKYFNIPKAEYKEPTWKDFFRNFVMIMSMNLLFSKSRNIAHRARYGMIDKNKAVTDIITIYCIACVVLLAIAFIGEFLNKRKEKQIENNP